MNNPLFQHPDRKRRVSAMLCASLIFHSALVGAAALWARTPQPGPPEFPPTTIDLPLDPNPAGPASLPAAPAPPAPPAAPEPEPQPMVDPIPQSEPPPPLDDLEITEPSTPRPLPPARIAPQHHTTRLPATTAAAPGSNSASGLVGATAGARGMTLTGVGAGAAGWKISKPPYPYPARSSRVQGVSTVRVATDALGRISSVVILKSAGNAILDQNTLQHVRAYWSGPPNAATVREVEYKLQ